ncbi:hypothetical protein KTH_55770 [Thermosporothrix hazakensis]|nr:hypothetical protein KTH_55770 [Thermosporothrix hazakensis]
MSARRASLLVVIWRQASEKKWSVHTPFWEVTCLSYKQQHKESMSM